MGKGELTTRPGDVRVIVHDPIPTEATAEPDMREVRRLAASVRAIIAPSVEEEARLIHPTDASDPAARP